MTDMNPFALHQECGSPVTPNSRHCCDGATLFPIAARFLISKGGSVGGQAAFPPPGLPAALFAQVLPDSAYSGANARSFSHRSESVGCIRAMQRPNGFALGNSFRRAATQLMRVACQGHLAEADHKHSQAHSRSFWFRGEPSRSGVAAWPTIHGNRS